ncbi:hypothetical protein FB45DRAFT_943164 [Roridomyces roridus]|uniref:Uncharacterized protein n=1 Tax=Roridomyces roridus TaxID=1738132 RepID=A0AAD7B4N6_9AGAR|nr:hypothetical protein FB45DRAFT_943164 [Roridomyces roridus]
MHLPHLSKLKLITMVPRLTKNILHPFIERHPDLMELVLIKENSESEASPTTSLERAPPMPKLRAFMGPEFISSLCLGASLADSLSYVAQHLPHTESLQLQVTDVDVEEETQFDQESSELVSQSLRSFTALRWLGFEYMSLVDSLETDTSRMSLEAYLADKHRADAWGNICPSLREMYFNGNPWRPKDSGWERCFSWEIEEPTRLQRVQL